MMTLRFLLLVLALVAFIAAAIGVQTRINLTAAGLALWVLTLLIS